jgi:hypothetical protein
MTNDDPSRRLSRLAIACAVLAAIILLALILGYCAASSSPVPHSHGEPHPDTWAFRCLSFWGLTTFFVAPAALVLSLILLIRRRDCPVPGERAIGCGTLFLVLLAGCSVVFLSAYVCYRFDNERSACINNLRLIDHAKEAYSIKGNPTDRGALSWEEIGPSSRLSNGYVVTWEDLAPYLDASVPPACPAGGQYSVNPIGSNPTCSLGGQHVYNPN